MNFSYTFLEHDYRGNVRELENIIEHCFVLCRGEIIEQKHLPASFKTTLEADYYDIKKAVTLKEMEKIFIINALKQNNGNRTAAAKQLCIHKSTLFRKLKSLNIEA